MWDRVPVSPDHPAKAVEAAAAAADLLSFSSAREKGKQHNCPMATPLSSSLLSSAGFPRSLPLSFNQSVLHTPLSPLFSLTLLLLSLSVCPSSQCVFPAEADEWVRVKCALLRAASQPAMGASEWVLLGLLRECVCVCVRVRLCVSEGGGGG